MEITQSSTHTYYIISILCSITLSISTMHYYSHSLPQMQTRSKTRARALLFAAEYKSRQMAQSASNQANNVPVASLAPAKSSENHSTRVLRSGTQGRSQSEMNQATRRRVSEGDSRENAQSMNTPEHNRPSTKPDEYQQTRYYTRSRSRALIASYTRTPVTPSAPVKSCASSVNTDDCDSDNDSASSECCDDDNDEDYQPVNLSKQFKKEAFAVRIDFAEASRAWRANKVSIGEGQFAYK